MRVRVACAPASALAALFAVVAWASPTSAASPDFTLNTRCPPSFELTARGVCEFRDRYQLYDSLQNRGVGGTRTSLPAHRDGFTPVQIDLGRYLFFDPMLSGDGTMSCGSCHRPDKGLADGRPRSIGVGGKDAGRAAPTLWNVAFLQRLTWDARAESLEAQAEGPLFSPIEMANEPARLLAEPQRNATYRRLFDEAFPSARRRDHRPRTSAARSPRSRATLVLVQQPLRSLRARLRVALSRARNRGPQRVPLVRRALLGVPHAAAVHQRPGRRDRRAEPAAARWTSAPKRPSARRSCAAGSSVPTLRNVTRTAPYMHSGAFATLRETVEFYNSGRGNAVPKVSTCTCTGTSARRT